MAWKRSNNQDPEIPADSCKFSQQNEHDSTAEEFPDFQTLRKSILADFPKTPAASLHPLQLPHFSVKTLIITAVAVIAMIFAFVSIDFANLSAAFTNANPFWMAASFTAALFTYLGGAITLNAYVQEPIKLGDSVLIQAAASLITIITPAGIGPAALNFRFLQKRGMPSAPALATVTLVQLAQLTTTLFLLLALSFTSGDFSVQKLPSGNTLTMLVFIAVIIVLISAIPHFRRFIWKKIEPAYLQVSPRLLWLFTHPKRLLLGFFGTIISAASFTACFTFALFSFGDTLPLETLAFTYLAANMLGSTIPTPGGIGPVEAALTGGLVIAGVPYSIAFSTAILYRLFTFWGRAPLGWIALQIAGKKNLV
ncbi:lysylphosphatidylglycerol synthase transmembrane domain-containing protein [Arcanobacterium hippocoleae]